MKDLLTNDAFLYLKSTFAKRRDETVTRIAKAMLTGTSPSPEKLAEIRGYWEGVEAVLNRPENADAAFVKALKRLAEEESNE